MDTPWGVGLFHVVVLFWNLAASPVQGQVPNINRTLSFDNLLLTEIPPDISNGTIELILAGNLLENQNFTNTSLADLTSLEILDLSNNPLGEFPDLQFLGPTLLELILREVGIATVNPELLEGLVNEDIVVFPNLTAVADTLTHFGIRGSGLLVIRAVDFEGFQKLEKLDLSQHHSSAFTIDFLAPIATTLYNFSPSGTVSYDGYTNLGHLETDSNGYREFPNLGSACNNTVSLSVGGNLITSISTAALQHCSKVTSVKFSRNLLTAFPNITVMGNTLTYLDVASNNISEVDPDFIRACTKLENVHMYSNHLTAIPDLTMSATTIELLNFANNSITHVDASLAESLTALENVHLDKNAIDEFPDFIQSNASLITLTLNTNKIPNVSAEALGRLQALEVLDLSNNLLSKIPSVAMPSLVRLYIGGNQFEALPSFQLLNASLKVLDIGNNSITFIRASDLSALEQLETLNLNYTLLTQIPSIEFLPKLLTLNISHTPITLTNALVTARLGQLKSLDMNSIDLTYLPTICPRDKVWLNIANTSNLNLCSRKMAWLKHPRVNLTFTDVVCSELGGKTWNESTYQELLTLDEPPPVPGQVKQFMLPLGKNGMAGMRCEWPTSGVYDVASFDKCMQECMAAEGCKSFLYNPNARRCVVVTPSARTVPLHNLANENWRFHFLI